MKLQIGYALTGSFCTFQKSLRALAALTQDYDVHPIFSDAAYCSDTRFGAAVDFIERVESLCGRAILHTPQQVEPLGPKAPLDLLIVAPCTGTTHCRYAGDLRLQGTSAQRAADSSGRVHKRRALRRC